MLCKVRNYQLIPDPKNPGKPMKANQNMNHIIYSETMYFPINLQQQVLKDIRDSIIMFPDRIDLEHQMNFLISIKWKVKYGLTTFKLLFPKENLGVLIGDPFFNFY